MIDLETNFLKFLAFPDLQERYKTERNILLKSLQEDQGSKHETQIERKLEGIKEDKEHRMVLNACIFPFCQEDSLYKYGYEFVRASPLSEEGLSNMDFLLYRLAMPSCLLFGEAKGKTTLPEQVVTQMRNRITEVYKHQKYLQENYISDTNAYYEFVIGTSFIYGNNLMKSVLRKRGGIIVWITGSMGSKPSLSIVTPSLEDGPTGKTMLHKDKELSQKLGKSIETSFDFKNIFPESHIYSKLLLLTAINSMDGVFSYEELFELVKEEMEYLTEEKIHLETKHILRVAQEIKFIELSDNNTYRIISRSKRADGRERELRKKWIDFSILKDNEHEFKNGLNQLKIDFIKKKGERKTILDYDMSYENQSKRVFDH